MLLQAIPEAIRTEVLANRLQTTLAILARIMTMTIYRPGSAVERQQVLKALESPGNASSPMELVVECLRKWARWLIRAQDLGLQVPDPSILLKGLDQSAKGQLERHGEVMFRANMLRYSLDLDASPVLGSVVKYHSHLLGEFEQIAYRGPSKASLTTAVRAMDSGANDGGSASSLRGLLHRRRRRRLRRNGASSLSPRQAVKGPTASSCMTGPASHLKNDRSAVRGAAQRATCARDVRSEQVAASSQGEMMERVDNLDYDLWGRGTRQSATMAQYPQRLLQLRLLPRPAERRPGGTTSGASSLGASTDSTSSSTAAPNASDIGGAPRDVDEFLRNATDPQADDGTAKLHSAINEDA